MDNAKFDGKGSWLLDLLLKFKPDPGPIDIDEVPETLISNAAWQAFAISTISSIPPGPVGMLTILPEVIAVTRLQVQLIFKIARYYEKETLVNRTIVALILGNAAGIATGRLLLKMPEGKIIIRRVAELGLQNFVARLGAKIMGRVIARIPGRWIPFLLSPVFGMMSKTATEKIGWEAVAIFSHDLEFEEEKASRE